MPNPQAQAALDNRLTCMISRNAPAPLGVLVAHRLRDLDARPRDWAGSGGRLVELLVD